MSLKAQEDPLQITTLGGEVVITGPRVAVALTAEAAAETARLLAIAATTASQGVSISPSAMQRLLDKDE